MSQIFQEIFGYFKGQPVTDPQEAEKLMKEFAPILTYPTYVGGDFQPGTAGLPGLAQWNGECWKGDAPLGPDSVWHHGSIEISAEPAPQGFTRCPYCGCKVFPDEKHCTSCGAPA